eukprot:scaffold20531_cov67-Cyclotella_meneghiniana.AAC.2
MKLSTNTTIVASGVLGHTISACRLYYPDWFLTGDDLEESVTCFEDNCRLEDYGLSMGAPALKGCCEKTFNSGWEIERCLKENDDCQDVGGGCTNPRTIVYPTDRKVLYETPSICCESGLSHVAKDYCVAQSLGEEYKGSNKYYVEDTAATRLIGKWFLSNPTDTVCSKDCITAELTANSGSPESYCADIPESRVVLFDSVEACCSGALWWINANSCASRTIGGYTNLWYWYAGNDGSKCLKDCDATAAGASEECAGHPEDTQAALYQDYASCCANKFGWDRENCLVSRQQEKLLQDCDGDAPCGGLAPSWITVKHDSVETCCSSHLYWVAKENCIAA